MRIRRRPSEVILWRTATLAMAATFLLAAMTPAAAAESREREALRRMQRFVQQLQQENARLEKALTEAKAEADKRVAEMEEKAQADARALNARMGAFAGEVLSLRRLVAEERDRLKAVNERLSGSRAEIRRIQAQARKQDAEHAARIEMLEDQNRKLVATVAVRGKAVHSCEAKNERLYMQGRELMAKYREKTCGDVWRQTEPMTQLGRVGMENMLQEYRDRLEAARVVQPR